MFLTAFNKPVLLLLILSLVSWRTNNAQIDSIKPEHSIVEYDTIYIPGDTIRKIDTLVVYLDKPINIKLFAALGSSTNYCNSVYSRKPGLTDEYFNKVTSLYRPAFGYSIDATAGIFINHFFISSGVSFYEFREKFTYTSRHEIYTNKMYVKIDTLDTYYVWENGNLVTYYSTREERIPYIDTTYIDSVHNIINNYQYIEIPVNIGYKYTFDNFSITAGGGLNFGIAVNGRQRLIVPGNDIPVDYGKDACKYQITGYNIGIGINYILKDSMEIYTGFTYKKYLDSMVKIDYFPENQMQLFGIKAGIVYFFRLSGS